MITNHIVSQNILVDIDDARTLSNAEASNDCISIYVIDDAFYLCFAVSLFYMKRKERGGYAKGVC